MRRRSPPRRQHDNRDDDDEQRHPQPDGSARTGSATSNRTERRTVELGALAQQRPVVGRTVHGRTSACGAAVCRSHEEKWTPANAWRFTAVPNPLHHTVALIYTGSRGCSGEGRSATVSTRQAPRSLDQGGRKGTASPSADWSRLDVRGLAGGSTVKMLAAVVVVSVVLVAPSLAQAASYAANWYSQQNGPSHAAIGGSVSVSSHSSGSSGEGSEPTPGSESSGGAPSSGGPSPANPTLPSTSPRLANPHPSGPNSFWYTTVNGERCIYEAASDGICFNVVTPAAPEEPAPPVNPAVLAAAAANRLSLGTGSIESSPSAHTDGLTGADSWFWLSPAPPSTQTVSAAERGEHVTVTATASTVRWTFGDGSSMAGGAGVPYQPGSVPSDAILHDYQTRCLPGDQGRDPYVLASCGPDGYTVTATVEWGVTFTAHGPVTRSGALPTRSTADSLTYPVSEDRAFLASAGGEK